MGFRSDAARRSVCNFLLSGFVMASETQNKQSRNEVDFLFEMRVLLDRYDVDIVATDDEQPYGMAQPLVELQFNRPYGVYQFTSISSADEVEDDEQNKTAG